MGIDIHFEDERGERLGALPDMDSLVEKFLPDASALEFPCLRFVDPYGDTVFNQAQIQQVLLELEMLSTREHEPEVGRHLRAVREFVQQAVDQTHTYIRFYGD